MGWKEKAKYHWRLTGLQAKLRPARQEEAERGQADHGNTEPATWAKSFLPVRI